MLKKTTKITGIKTDNTAYVKKLFNESVPITGEGGFKPLLTTRELAEILRIGKSTLEQDRLYGRLQIPWIRLGRSIRYKASDVEKYLESLKTFTSTSDIGK